MSFSHISELFTVDRSGCWIPKPGVQAWQVNLRYVWEEYCSGIFPGGRATNTCGNPKCINVRHMEFQTWRFVHFTVRNGEWEHTTVSGLHDLPPGFKLVKEG